jgi:hypothetical protein
MKRLRYWFIGLCIWFFFLYNVERIGEPINLATFVYIYAIVVAVLLILIPALQRISFAWLLIGSMVPYLFLKSSLNYSLSLGELPIIVTEICALGITMFLTRHLGRRLESIYETLADLTIGHLGEEAVPFSTGQSLIYSEIRRARLYSRPATLLAISATKESVELSIDYFVQEAQREIVKQYIAARISDLLIKELNDCDIVARRQDHFVTLLPEATRETVLEVVNRIKEEAAEKLNLDLKIGWATFPEEAVTFESMLAIAENQMATNNKEEIKHEFPGFSTAGETFASPQPEKTHIQQETPVSQTL